MAQAGTQVALGLGAAAAWGGGDFSGGLAAKKAPPSLVVAIAHAFSLLLLLTAAVPQHNVFDGHEFYGLCSGALCGAGLIALYSALARGAMGLVAAVSGVLTALVPVIFSLECELRSHNGHFSASRFSGFLFASMAIWLIAKAPGGNKGQVAAIDFRSLSLAVTAGLSFGVMLILMHLAAPYGTLPTLIEMRLMSMSIAAVGGFCFWLTHRRSERGPGSLSGSGVWLSALAAGVFDTGGNLLYLYAARAGRLDVAAVVSSLYPAGTMLLAAGLLKERATRSQSAGMILAVVAIFLIAI